MAPIITLTTDFGLQDEYVGVLKGVLLGRAPQASLVDLCHLVEPGDVAQAAFLLKAALPYFPAGTIHLAVVDPGVGTARRLLALRARDHLFVAPDNGLLTPFLDEDNTTTVVLSCPQLCLQPLSSTFHGRDILAPAAAALASGADLASLGRKTAGQDLVRLAWAKLQIDPIHGTISGSVLHIDRFGNLTTDIHRRDLAGLPGEPTAVRIVLKGTEIRGLATTYGERAAGTALALIGSRGFLEVAVNRGNAALLLGAVPGDPVLVHAGKQ
jgi:S-adenosyl-L-methionine hydrolase (adenosine-forming)